MPPFHILSSSCISMLFLNTCIPAISHKWFQFYRSCHAFLNRGKLQSRNIEIKAWSILVLKSTPGRVEYIKYLKINYSQVLLKQNSETTFYSCALHKAHERPSHLLYFSFLSIFYFQFFSGALSNQSHCFEMARG